MAKLAAFARLMRRKIKVKNIKATAKVATVAAGGGALGAFTTGQPGHRGDAASEGATYAGLLGAAGSIVFRRVRGRIIPIRVKK